MIDSTAVRATRALSGAGKNGFEEPQDHPLGRSQVGLTTRIYMRCDANGVPLRLLLSGGQANDIAYAQTATRSGVHSQPAWSLEKALPMVAG